MVRSFSGRMEFVLLDEWIEGPAGGGTKELIELFTNCVYSCSRPTRKICSPMSRSVLQGRDN